MVVSEAINFFTGNLAEFLGADEAGSSLKIALEKITGISRSELRLNRDHKLSDEEIKKLQSVVLELKSGRPLQYILREAWFYNLPFYVDDNVLIPRPETEELVDLIVKQYDFDKPKKILDIGTGSGCIAISIAHCKPDWRVYGIDVSKGALDVASKNARSNNTNVLFQLVDVLSDVHTNDFFQKHGPFDIIVSNPPYIGIDEKKIMNRNVLDFEPHVALFPTGSDVLLFYKRINMLAQNNLRPGGELYYEINEFKGHDMQELMKMYNFNAIELIKDISDKDRIIRAVK